jgi:hypothetical protein
MSASIVINGENIVVFLQGQLPANRQSALNR